MPKKNKKSRFGANVAKDVSRRETKESSYGYLKLPKGVSIFKEKEGRVSLDIIPYIVSAENHLDANPDAPDSALVGNPWYKKPILVHRNVGVDKQAIVCPGTQKKKCPICEERARQLKDGVDYEDAEKKPQLRNLYLVIPINNKDHDEKIHLWDISEGNFQKILDEELKEDPELGVFPDPEYGMTLKIRFNEATFAGNKYYEAGRIDFKDRSEAYDEAVMEEYDLDEFISIMSYKDIEKIYLGIDDEDYEEDEDEDEDERPAVNFRKKKKGKPVEDEDDEDEDEDDEDEDEEDEDEKPKRRNRRRKTKPVEDDDDEDDDDEDEEDEDDEDEEETARLKNARVKSNKSKIKRKKAGKLECPNGYEIGKDWDEYVECDDCPIFEECGKLAD